ncbi:MAG: hypothetical protein ABSG46_15720 [Candidatus Binataceae bacterium]
MRSYHYAAQALGARAARCALWGAECLLLICCALVIVAGSANAQDGRRNFFSPLVTADPDPDNSLDILPQWTGVEHGSIVAVAFSLEKQLSENSSIEIGDAWNDPMCEKGFLCDDIGPLRRGGTHQTDTGGTRSAASSGMDDLEILTEYAFFKSDRHELRIAAGTDMFIAAGNPDAGADTFFYGGPILMIAKGMGDLPDDGFARFLQPFAIQADLEYLFESGGNRSNDLAADWVISYSFSYLNSYVEKMRWPHVTLNLIPFAEFTYDQSVLARQITGQPNLLMLPGIAYVNDNNTWQLSVATTFAVNRATVASNHAGVITMLNLSLDNCPIFNWQLLKSPSPTAAPECCTGLAYGNSRTAR